MIIGYLAGLLVPVISEVSLRTPVVILNMLRSARGSE